MDPTATRILISQLYLILESPIRAQARMYSFSSSDASLSLQMAFEEGRTLANEATAFSRKGESERD